MKIKSIMLFAACLALYGCDSSDNVETQSAADNSVVRGAVWCPPCQEIKHTVFKSKQFVAQTKFFVPIYLDGDTERAQAWGETFGVKGYPTMIVFNPAGEEITRIPGGIDISRYNTVLDLSLNAMRPTSMLVQFALNDPSTMQSSDFVQLAYYSWGQDFDSLPKGTPAIANLFADSLRALAVSVDGSRAYAAAFMSRHLAPISWHLFQLTP